MPIMWQKLENVAISNEVAFSCTKRGGMSVNIKKWYLCPHCGKKILRYDEIKAKSNNIYIKCKQCKKEIEIKID